LNQLLVVDSAGFAAFVSILGKSVSSMQGVEYHEKTGEMESDVIRPRGMLSGVFVV
jgi:hypothetical protein